MKAIKLKTQKAKARKIQFSIYDTYWINPEFINHEGFNHRKLRDFSLDKLPFVSTDIFDWYVMWFEGDAVRIMHNRINDDAFICAGDYALFAGYENLDSMMLDNEILDSCNLIKKLTGRFPIQRIIVQPIF